jgi:LacI family transcriptional regulator
MAPRKSVTIKDVAAAANVSRATAARALNGYGYVGVAWPLHGVILNLCVTV